MHVYKRLLILSGISLTLACATRQGPEQSGEKGGVADDPEAAPATEANVTPEMIGLGENIFKGREAGGICYTCHGPDATGTPTGPNLTDNEWIRIDGNTSSIAKIIREGVTDPKQYQSPMPAFTSFTDEQVQALAAYVYSLSHPGVGGQQQQQPPQGQEQEPQQPQQPQ